MALAPDVRSVSATAHVFGHDPVTVRLTLVPRSPGWRASRAARYLVGGAVLAPLVAIVPPHAPWAVGAGAGGLVLGLRKWGERFTLTAVDGLCPRCGAPLPFGGATPLKTPHSLGCEECGNPVILRIDPAELPEA